MPHCKYKPTNNTTGYQNTTIGSTVEAKRRYGSNMGLTLLKAVTSNENSTAKDSVVLSVGPISQQHGIREENPSEPGTFYRNPINKKRAVTTSILLSGIGLASTYMAIQSAKDSHLTHSLMYGVLGASSLLMMPDYEVRYG